MALQGFGFVGEHYQDYSLRIGIEETRNLYPAIVASPTARVRVVLQNVPGLQKLQDLNSSHAPTAMLYDDGVLYLVSEGQFIEASYTAYGVLGAVDQGPAKIVSNGRQGHQVVIHSGLSGYVLDTQTNAFGKITDPNFPASCRTLEYIAGVIVALDNETGQFIVSAPFDATSYSGLAVSIRQLTSDKVIHIQELGGDLWVFGSKTIDAWRLTGNTVSVFEPVIGSTIHRGVRSPETVVNIAGGFAFLGDGEHGGMSVYHTQGYNAVQISTPAVDFRLRSYMTSSDIDTRRISLAATATAYGYEEAGHSFYVLNLPDLKTSMVYDFTTNLWHERNKWNTTSGTWEAHIGRCHVWAFDEHLIGAPGGIYRQALDLHTFDGAPRRWLRRAPHIGDGSLSTFHRRLHVDMEVGVGAPYGTTTDNDIYDPKIMERHSNDFGFTWSSERTQPVGKLGEYSTEINFWQLGRSKGARVYELSGAYPAKTVIADVTLDAMAGFW